MSSPAWAQSISPDGALLPVKVDQQEGQILLTLSKSDETGDYGTYLYTTSLRTGMGSAQLWLDHGMFGPTQLLSFRRHGNKIAATFENPRFKATGDAGVTRGGEESFPVSIAWMGPIVSENGDNVVIDIAPFLTQDSIGISDSLNRQADGKDYRYVPGRSMAKLDSVKVFPKNIEMDSIETFASDKPGSEVSLIAPDPKSLSFEVHHSFVQLPEPGYTPRKFDVRSAANGKQVFDFGVPLDTNIVHDFALRFRVDKTDPTAARSPVKKPIVFYIDNAAPEPIRSALKRGVGWWSDAFDAAGLIGGFQVKILPEDADPLDIRYNMVNWGNRMTRSWSYGQTVTDPRTGEIIKGAVVLGALRVRQDMTIFEALVGADETDSGSPNDPVKASLARISQLGAHEVGHSLGFMHNFAASTQDRASVMDYPGPFIKLTNGKIDISDAYDVGIGEWDKFAIDWLYGQPAPGVDPDAAAAAKALAAQKAGMRFATDIDGRSPDGPSPWASMWDNGPDPAAELNRLMKVRAVAIANFGPQVLHDGEPMADLRRKFVPVWLLHRYQVDAAAKLIGGMDVAYTVAGDGQPAASPVPATQQRAALDALLATLTPEALSVPDDLIGTLSAGINGPRNIQFDREVFANAGSAVFDPLVATDIAAQIPLDTLLAPTRLTRVYEQSLRDSSQLGLDTLVDRLVATAMENASDPAGRRIAYRTFMTMARNARMPEMAPEVAAILSDRLQQASATLAKASGSGMDAAWRRHMAQILSNPALLQKELTDTSRAPAIPPGMPIGG
ncbi:DUF5117 domain-containing protein [Altericroceibacterium spongiae]|uniref:DUF5117 domain-containing protein n=2 Tax=Altericroceibacterium spongiae TaxID=2320269 RepID=A0A420EQ23_9SPHN|nr:DUF5117 domain-containing protein [Altericroceibacterium spongiae]